MTPPGKETAAAAPAGDTKQGDQKPDAASSPEAGKKQGAGAAETDHPPQTAEELARAKTIKRGQEREQRLALIRGLKETNASAMSAEESKAAQLLIQKESWTKEQGSSDIDESDIRPKVAEKMNEAETKAMLAEAELNDPTNVLAIQEAMTELGLQFMKAKNIKKIDVMGREAGKFFGFNSENEATRYGKEVKEKFDRILATMKELKDTYHYAKLKDVLIDLAKFCKLEFIDGKGTLQKEKLKELLTTADLEGVANAFKTWRGLKAERATFGPQELAAQMDVPTGVDPNASPNPNVKPAEGAGATPGAAPDAAGTKSPDAPPDAAGKPPEAASTPKPQIDFDKMIAEGTLVITAKVITMPADATKIDETLNTEIAAALPADLTKEGKEYITAQLVKRAHEVALQPNEKIKLTEKGRFDVVTPADEEAERKAEEARKKQAETDAAKVTEATEEGDKGFISKFIDGIMKAIMAILERLGASVGIDFGDTGTVKDLVKAWGEKDNEKPSPEELANIIEFYKTIQGWQKINMPHIGTLVKDKEQMRRVLAQKKSSQDSWGTFLKNHIDTKNKVQYVSGDTAGKTEFEVLQSKPELKAYQVADILITPIPATTAEDSEVNPEGGAEGGKPASDRDSAGGAGHDRDPQDDDEETAGDTPANPKTGPSAAPADRTAAGPSEGSQKTSEKVGSFFSFEVDSKEKLQDFAREITKDPEWKRHLGKKIGEDLTVMMKLLEIMEDPSIEIDPELRRLLNFIDKNIKEISAQTEAASKKMFPEGVEKFIESLTKKPDWQKDIGDQIKTSAEFRLKIFGIVEMAKRSAVKPKIPAEVLTFITTAIKPYEAETMKAAAELIGIHKLQEGLKKEFPELMEEDTTPPKGDGAKTGADPRTASPAGPRVEEDAETG